MDTSPEYIEMCRKAKELQETWVPEEGDFYCYQLKKTYPVYVYTVSESDFIDYGVGRWWLPRIDQLITLSNMPWQEFLFEVVEYSAGVSEPAEIAALHQLMELLYKKEWKGEDWILCQE